MAVLEMASMIEIQPVRLSDLAEKQNIPLKYLEQIFVRLKRAGIVRSSRGPGGGYLLNSQTERLSVADVIDAVEENIKMTRCASNGVIGCMPQGKKCATHDLWHGLELNIRKYLSEISLLEIASGKAEYL